MLHVVKAAVGPSCLWGLIGAMGLSACRRDVERAGEPIAHLRLLIDTVAPAMTSVSSMQSLGDSVFDGRVGDAPCSRCHGTAPVSGMSASDLAQSHWLRGASYGTVVHFLVHGERDHRGEDPGARHPGVSRLSPHEIRAVALYVVTLAARPHSEESR